MRNKLDDREIAQLGILIDKHGRAIYNAMARKFGSPKIQEIFRYLAQEEERHILVFQKILEKTGQYEPVGLGADEYFAYMNALAGDYVFTQKGKGEEAARAITGEQEAIETGIKFEKDSVLFYEGIKGAVPEHDHKTVDELIKQEQHHLSQLYEAKRAFI